MLSLSDRPCIKCLNGYSTISFNDPSSQCILLLFFNHKYDQIIELKIKPFQFLCQLTLMGVNQEQGYRLKDLSLKNQEVLIYFNVLLSDKSFYAQYKCQSSGYFH